MSRVDQAVEHFVDSDIADRTYDTPDRLPVNCERINEVLEWDEDQEQPRGTVETIAEYVGRLRRVPVEARAVLSVVVDRGVACGDHENFMSCLAHDVAQAIGTSEEEVHPPGGLT
jgi:hypothetical protein